MISRTPRRPVNIITRAWFTDQEKTRTHRKMMGRQA